MMWLLAMSAALLPMYQKASQGRYFTVVRSSAEAGLDYAVSVLNLAIKAGTTCPIDDATTDGVSVTSTVPAYALSTSSAQVTLEVNNIGPPSTSSIYDAQWDPALTGAPNCWRLVTATATYAGLQKQIRVILKPEPGATATTSSQVPYFQYAMFGKTSVSLSGYAATDAYDSRNGAYGGTNKDNYGGDVGSNGSSTMSGNAKVGGDLRIYSKPKGSLTAVVAQASGNARVLDQVVTNGVSSGFHGTIGPLPLPIDNVLAQGQGTPLRTGDWTTPIDLSQSFDQVEIPPAKGVPANAQVITGTTTWSGDTGWVAQPGSGQVADLGNLSISGNNTLNIRPGSYKISSLSISGNAQLTIQPNPSGSYGPVTFFVEGIAPGSNVVQISGNGIVNQSAMPSNFQMWYNGSKNIQLSGNGNLHAVVYAPNSAISVSGNGTYFGAVFGNTVNDSGNGMVHFDKALLQTSGAAALTFTHNQSQLGASALKTRSWQEF